MQSGNVLETVNTQTAEINWTKAIVSSVYFTTKYLTNLLGSKANHPPPTPNDYFDFKYYFG